MIKPMSNELDSFITYCKANPEQRFWQALRNWAGVAYIFAGNDKDRLEDTFYYMDVMRQQSNSSERPTGNMTIQGKVIAVDVDGTLTKGTAWNVEDAINAEPRWEVIEKINKLHKNNFIVIHTARRDDMYQATKDWLDMHGVKYQTIATEKMVADIYIDDKALRPEEI
jgi:hypothetical protein